MTSAGERGAGTRPRALLVAGARPNFVKVAPIHAVLAERRTFEPLLVHTGQHYDERMSKVFLDELGLPAPDVNLGVGSASHARQTAEVMVTFDAALERLRPDVVLVVGDVNSTLGAAIVTQRRGVPLCHVEAGLRSGDRSMPEEINRVLTDQLSDWLYTPSADAEPNLLAEGIAPERVVFVGNVMIDSLVRCLEPAEREDVLERLGLAAGGYALVTLHRPSNVDDPERLGSLVAELARLSLELPVIFPVHPRTRGPLGAHEALLGGHPGLRLVEPQAYLAFLKLTRHARLVVTDSGGIQEETTFHGVPCVTVRENTERPITVSEGTNVLAGTDPVRLRAALGAALTGGPARPAVPERWDGRAAERVVDHLEKIAGK